MSDRAHSAETVRTFINAGLVVALIVMAASFYVRFVEIYPPLWTAFAMPVAMALFGLRLMLMTPDLHHDGRSQRTIGGLLVALSFILLVVGLYELDRANKSRAANFNPNPTATDPLNSTVPTDTAGDE